MPTETERAVTSSAAMDQLISGRAVLCDGAMGTMLYARGVFINRCFDELNLSQPDLVRTVHMEYLQAGAEIIETNTFGANSVRLERFGLQAKTREINLAGIRLARESVQAIAEKLSVEAYVAGAIGPLGVRLEPFGKLSRAEARSAFTEQIRSLAEGGPGVGADLLIAETIASLDEAEEVIKAAKAEAPTLPILVMLTMDEAGQCLDGETAEVAAERMVAWGADAIGCNCSSGPAIVLDVIERMRKVVTVPLGAMPNAGVPRSVDGRSIYLTSPEYMASFARKFVKAGVSLVGGCCGTTPSHIRAMRGTLRALEAQIEGVEVGDAAATKEAKTEPPALKDRSQLGALIAAGKFCTLVEIVPPRGFDSSREIEGAAYLHRLGVHAINVPDSPRASARMSAQSLCVQIQQQVGIETVLHTTCRDRNVLSMQSDLLGAASMGVKNILCLTGDPPKLGNYPDATAVFDVDAVGLTRIVRGLNHGLDIGNNALAGSTGFTISVAANPGVADVDEEIRRFEHKVEAGAEFCITQPVFDLRLLEQFLRRIEGFRIPVIAGIWPLTSAKNADFMKKELKVSMPDEVMNRMLGTGSPEEARAEGVQIAQEMVGQVRAAVQGVQVSAPFGKYAAAAQVLDTLLPAPKAGR